MKVEDVIKAKKELEHDLRSAIDKFESKVGIVPDEIEINIYKTDGGICDSKNRQSVVGSICATIVL